MHLPLTPAAEKRTVKPPIPSLFPGLIQRRIHLALPKTSRSHSSGCVSDISSASIAELTRLYAEVLRLHLLSQHLITTGNKVTLARRLHEALHLTVPATTADSTGNVTVPPPTFTLINSSPSTPATETVIHRQPTYSESPICHQPYNSNFPRSCSNMFTMPLYRLIYHQLPTVITATDL